MINTIKTQLKPIHILCLALFFLMLNFGLHFPGEMTNDSKMQLDEALAYSFSDIHPPVMAFVWSYLIRFFDAEPAMLAFHLTFHWMGLCLISLGLLRIERRLLSIAVLLLGFFPVLIYHNGFLHKDVGMASTFMAAFSIVFYFKIQDKRVPKLLYIPVLLLLTYGFLVRANGIFALGPLLLYVCLGTYWQKKIIRPLFASLLIAVVALPASQVLNQQALHARSLESTYSLFLFDLAGIAKNANDLSVLPASTHISSDSLARCYTPFWWDPFSYWGECRASTAHFGEGNQISEEQLQQRKALKGLWVHAILKHPMAYLEHRLKVFNSELYFIVPAYHCQYASGCGVGQDNVHATKLDYVKNNVLFWPVFWMVIGGIVLILLPSGSTHGLVGAARMLLLSGELYLMALSLIGIATVNRYAYWPILAILLGLFLSVESMKVVFQERKRAFTIGLAVLMLTVMIGLLARLTHFTLFVS